MLDAGLCSLLLKARHGIRDELTGRKRVTVGTYTLIYQQSSDAFRLALANHTSRATDVVQSLLQGRVLIARQETQNVIIVRYLTRTSCASSNGYHEIFLV